MNFFSLDLSESLQSCNGSTAFTGHYENGKFVIDKICPGPKTKVFTEEMRANAMEKALSGGTIVMPATK